jgi:hypothetical protein
MRGAAKAFEDRFARGCAAKAVEERSAFFESFAPRAKLSKNRRCAPFNFATRAAVGAKSIK